jgi:hypothetical protein
LLDPFRVIVGLQESDLSFAISDYPLQERAAALAVADVTRDSAPDVVISVPTNSPSGIEVWPNDGSGAFPERQHQGSYQSPATIKAGDLNGTGRADLAVMHSGGYSAIGTYEQRPDGFGPEQLFELPKHNGYHHGNDAMAIADVTGDGRPDVVAADRSKIVVMRNTTPRQ